MIIARMTSDNAKTIVVGLSQENVKRLMDNKPILKDLTEFGFPDVHLLILGGETEEDILGDLKTIGLIMPDTEERKA